MPVVREELADRGITYTNAYTTACVCAPSRSAIITGMYQFSLGTQHHRTTHFSIPYQATTPSNVGEFTELLRVAGYHTSSYDKLDYQFEPSPMAWDEASREWSPSFREPWFHYRTLRATHESNFFTVSDVADEPGTQVPPMWPNVGSVRRSIALMKRQLRAADDEIKGILDAIRSSGQYDRTMVFFFSDHGGPLPAQKRAPDANGLHIPLVVKYPFDWRPGTRSDALVSAIDLAPTALAVAKLPIPTHMQGRVFLDHPDLIAAYSDAHVAEPSYVFAGSDRIGRDSAYDRVRVVISKDYMYVHNFNPELPAYKNSDYRNNLPMMQDLLYLRDTGRLVGDAAYYFRTRKERTELYHLTSDPYCVDDVHAEPDHSSALADMDRAFARWLNRTVDKSEQTELQMLIDAWGRENVDAGLAPSTAAPTRTRLPHRKVSLHCATPDATIGYTYERSAHDALTVYTSPIDDADYLYAMCVRRGYQYQAASWSGSA